MKPVIFFHGACADGYGAAFAAWKQFGDNAEYIPMRYGQIKSIDDVDLLGLVKNRRVFVLDFSFPHDVTEYLVAEAEEFVWLDHHRTAFEMWVPDMPFTDDIEYRKTDARSYICLDNKRSGALIAWNFFIGMAPLMIRHIDDYDRWQFKLDETKAFNKYLWSIAPWSFEKWDILCSGDANTYGSAYDMGNALLAEHKRQVVSATKNAREVKLNGQTGLCVNAPPNLTSDSGHDLAARCGSFGLIYHIDHELRVKCSLRSTGDYDVSALAKLYGGGGHKNAAGFELSIQGLIEILN